MAVSYKAIIWDCDGVLMDSPVLGCKAAAEMLTEHGYPITLDKYLRTFMGKGIETVLAAVDQEMRLGLKETFPRDELFDRQKNLFSSALKAIPGIPAVLLALQEKDVPMAVASDSDSARLRHTLEVIGVADRFGGHLYSGNMVANRKPAPDLFLLAAEKLGVDPKDCLVIEDSPSGILAARAAGMGVYAFVGGSHIFDEQQEKIIATQPDKVITDIQQILPEFITNNDIQFKNEGDTNMKIYFAHPINTYGTEGEATIVNALESTGYKVVNPNSEQCKSRISGFRAEYNDKAISSPVVMGYFVGICDGCDGSAFLAFEDGKIGAGVAKEIKSFFDRGAPVFEVALGKDGETVRMEQMKEYPADRILSVDETRARVYPTSGGGSPAPDAKK